MMPTITPPMIRRHRSLLLFAAFMTFDLVMIGAFVRISDAGLGCPDWPGCYGHFTPLQARSQIDAALAVQPQGPVSHAKAWIEMIHRYLASALGLLTIWLGWNAWRMRRAAPALASACRVSVGWAAATIMWIIVQGLFGKYTVTMRLQPAIVTVHLLGGVGLLLLFVRQWADIGVNVGASLRTDIRPDPSGPSGIMSAPRAQTGTQAPAARAAACVDARQSSWRPWAWLAFSLVMVQIALGGWVSSNYATLACQDFPKCGGQWIPPMDFKSGFEVWRPLGLGSDHLPVPFEALTAIHVTHRTFAFVVLAVAGTLAWRIASSGRESSGRKSSGRESSGRTSSMRASADRGPTSQSSPAPFRTAAPMQMPTHGAVADDGRAAGLARSPVRIARWIGLLLGLQLLTGLTNIFLDWPLVAAVLHTGGAAAIASLLLVLDSALSPGRMPASPVPMPEADRA